MRRARPDSITGGMLLDECKLRFIHNATLGIGWKLKEIDDDSERRELREQTKVAEDRALLTHEQIGHLKNQLLLARDQIAHLENQIARLELLALYGRLGTLEVG